MSGAIILLGTMYGVLALVLALLNRRDGRADALRGTIAASLTRELRDTALSRGTTLSVIAPRPAPDCETSIRVIRSVAARTLTALGA